MDRVDRVGRVDMDLTGVDKMVCMVMSKMVTRELVKTFCEEYFHFFSLVMTGGICGLVLQLWVGFRFKDVLKHTYCGLWMSLQAQQFYSTRPAGPPGLSELPGTAHLLLLVRCDGDDRSDVKSAGLQEEHSSSPL